MEVDKFVAAVERFFLDIVGLVVPGCLLLLGLYAAVGTVKLGSLVLELPTTSAGWTFFVVLAYVLGHAITSAGEVIVAPISARVARIVARKGYTGPAMRETDLLRQIVDRPTVGEFVQLLRGEPVGQVAVPPIREAELREYRSVAMTVSRPEDRAIAVRFMFLSLLNLGIATVLWLLGIAFAIRLAVDGGSSVGKGVTSIALNTAVGLGALATAVVLSIPFLQRRFYFYKTSMALPFATAVGVLRNPRVKARSPLPGAIPARTNKRLVVYLAGGLRTGWQEDVMAAAPEFDFLNPRDHGLKDPAAYSAWDLAAIRSCDLVFAYFEGTNPGGYGLSLEVGYASALGKPVILVDEKSQVDGATRRYFLMVREVATYTTESIRDGLRFLKARRLHTNASA